MGAGWIKRSGVNSSRNPARTKKSLRTGEANIIMHTIKTSTLISPCGGELVDLMAPAESID